MGVARAKATAGPRTVWGRPGVAMLSTVAVARVLIPKSSRCNKRPGIVGSVRPPSNVSWRAVCSNGIRLRRGRSSGQIWNLRSFVRRWPSFKQPVNSLWWRTIRPLSKRFLRKIRRLTMPGIMNVDVGDVEHLAFSGGEPGRLRSPVALGAVAISTGVIADVLVGTLITPGRVSPKGHRPTDGDGAKGAVLLRG